jgi:hypothetical protein
MAMNVKEGREELTGFPPERNGVFAGARGRWAQTAVASDQQSQAVVRVVVV